MLCYSEFILLSPVKDLHPGKISSFPASLSHRYSGHLLKYNLFKGEEAEFDLFVYSTDPIQVTQNLSEKCM
jgi:hypothetical protein